MGSSECRRAARAHQRLQRPRKLEIELRARKVERLGPAQRERAHGLGQRLLRRPSVASLRG